MSVTNCSSFVFCPPPLGKPNPKETRPAYGPDTRSRILQKGLKDNTCWYAAFNFIRDRYKAPNTHSLKARHFEIIASERRKALSAHESTLHPITHDLNRPDCQQFLSKSNKTSIQHPFAKKILNELSRAYKASLSSVLSDFSSQSRYLNLYDYLVYLKTSKRIEIDESFLSKAKINIRESLESLKKSDPLFYEALREQNSHIRCPELGKATALDYLVKEVSIKAYNLHVSSWMPTQPFESLAAEIQRHGPLIVFGTFGRSFYEVPPKKLEKTINNRDIYGWSKTDKKIPGTLMIHAVLLVGAEKIKNRQLVYYIDPIDPSDPSHRETQRIYAMSYERFSSPEHLSDTAGALRTDAPKSVGYALYKAPNPPFKEEDLLEELAFQRQIVDRTGLKSIFYSSSET